MEKIAIIGMGTMGSAIENVLKDDYEVTGIGRRDSLQQVEAADTVILAVKPRQFKEEVAEELWPYVHDQLFVSTMAGVKVRRLRQLLGTERIVRTMPNLALATGNSLTAWYAEDQNTDMQAVQRLLGKWGKTMRLEREKQFNAFTALAGSGPAYFFRVARVMVKKALGDGFTDEQARQIATYTLWGTASVVSPETDYDERIMRVASKGGTTEAGGKVLDDGDFDGILRAAIDAAACRSEELDS